MPKSLKNVHCIHKTCFSTFNDFGVYPITENFPVFLQVFEAIWKTAANPGETFTQSCAEKYKFLCILPHEILLSIAKVMNAFPYL